MVSRVGRGMVNRLKPAARGIFGCGENGKPLSALKRQTGRRATAKIYQFTKTHGPIYGSINLPTRLSILRHINLPIYPSTKSPNISIYLSTSLELYPAVNLSTFQYIHLSTYQSINIYISISINLSINSPTDQSINLPTY